MNVQEMEARLQAKLAELNANNEASTQLRAEFAEVRKSYRAGDRKAERRMEEIDAELTRRSQMGFRLNNEYLALARELSSHRQANRLNDYIARHWL
jgi:hypothetical protein